MSDVVLLSLPADEPAARAVVEALHGQKLEFWWEQVSPVSDEVLDAARCVVLIWTDAAGRDERFLALARRAAVRDQALIARLGRSAPPADLTGVTAVDLSRFRGRKGDPFLLDLLAAARAKAAGIDPTPPRGPLARMLQRLALMISTALVALSVLANVLGVISIKDMIRHPSADERLAWKALKPGSCDDLRAFRGTFPDGYYYDKATAALVNPERRATPRWELQSAPLVVFAGRDGARPSASRAAAAEAATARAQDQADKDCRRLKEINGNRFRAAAITPGPANCTQMGGGDVCSRSADVTCRFDARIEDTVEVCATPTPQ